MSDELRPNTSATPIACDLTKMDAEQSERYRLLRRWLSEAVSEARELEDGYAFRHSSGSSVLLALAEYVSLERLCCPFFNFAIEVENNGGHVWLRITGGQETKRILRAAQTAAPEV